MLIRSGVEVECHINPVNLEMISYLSMQWARTWITYGSIIGDALHHRDGRGNETLARETGRTFEG
jgi:hypothetical protein